MRKVSSCFLLLHLCDVIQFRDDHARMRIRGHKVNCFELLCPTYKLFLEILGHIFGDKIQKKENLPYGWLTLEMSNDGC